MTVFAEILGERAYQDAKWGEQNHGACRWLTILMEELGEASQAALENRCGDYRAELVQVAAVAVTAIESLDRQSTRFREAGDG